MKGSVQKFLNKTIGNNARELKYTIEPQWAIQKSLVVTGL
jgi:hypothetical protein